LKYLAEMVYASADVMARLMRNNVVSPYIGVSEKLRCLEVHEQLSSLILSAVGL